MHLCRLLVQQGKRSSPAIFLHTTKCITTAKKSQEKRVNLSNRYDLQKNMSLFLDVQGIQGTSQVSTRLKGPWKAFIKIPGIQGFEGAVRTLRMLERKSFLCSVRSAKVERGGRSFLWTLNLTPTIEPFNMLLITKLLRNVMGELCWWPRGGVGIFYKGAESHQTSHHR